MKLYKKVSRTRIVISSFNQKTVKGRNEDKAEKWFSAKILGKLKYVFSGINFIQELMQRFATDKDKSQGMR